MPLVMAGTLAWPSEGSQDRPGLFPTRAFSLAASQAQLARLSRAETF